LTIGQALMRGSPAPIMHVMSTPTDPREPEFRHNVLAEYAALYPLANTALEALLQRNRAGAARSRGTIPLARGIEIRNIGRLAGQCTRDGTIVVNSQLIDHPDAIRATVAHELAHAVVETARRQLLSGGGARRLSRGRADIARRRGDWSAHGAAWRSVARELGDGGERCHRLPLKPLRRLRRFLYRADCGAEVQLTTIRHNRLQRNRRLSYCWNARGITVSGRHFVREIDTA
jgi:predicted SprT family Zn-dependent metalloprotease